METPDEMAGKVADTALAPVEVVGACWFILGMTETVVVFFCTSSLDETTIFRADLL